MLVVAGLPMSKRDSSSADFPKPIPSQHGFARRIRPGSPQLAVRLANSIATGLALLSKLRKHIANDRLFISGETP